MPPNWYVAIFVEYCLRAAHIMKVCVQHGNNRARRVLLKFGKRVAHFFNRLTSINGNDSVWCVDKRLVRETIAHESPHAWRHLIEAFCKNFRMCDVVAVCNLAIGKRLGQLCVGLKTFTSSNLFGHAYTVGE